MSERPLREIDIKAAEQRAALLRNFQPPERLRKNMVFRMIRSLQTSFIEKEGRYPTMEEVAAAIREKYEVALSKSAINDLVAVTNEKKEASNRLSELQDRLMAAILLKREEKGLEVKNPKKEFLLEFLRRTVDVGVRQTGEELELPFKGSGTNLVRLAKADFLGNPQMSEEVVAKVKNAYQQVFTEVEERLKRGKIRARTGGKPLWERLDEWKNRVERDSLPHLGTYWEAVLTTHLIPVFDEYFSSESFSWLDRLVLENLRKGRSVTVSAENVNQQLEESPYGYPIELQPQEIALARSMILGKFEKN